LQDSPSSNPSLPRSLQIALFCVALVYSLLAEIVASYAARGLAMRFATPNALLLLQEAAFLFLLWIGFSALERMTPDEEMPGGVLGLPRRRTAPEEWSRGAAIGWGAVVLLVLPMLLGRSLFTSFSWTANAWRLVVLNLATLAVGALAEEVATRGYPFQRLIKAIGPAWATVLLSFIFGLLHIGNPNATWLSTLATVLAGILLSLAWLRTHALWLGWGFHFAWNASIAVLFGLPLSGLTDFSSVVQTMALRPLWLTGGAYGPERSLLVFPVLLIAIAVLVRLSRDYAWNYTHPVIVGRAYEVVVPPPAAHAAMESEAQPQPLVQILPTTPRGSGESYVSPPPAPLP
jgi:membrane protease YdiL (CAAX protease family)